MDRFRSADCRRGAHSSTPHRRIAARQSGAAMRCPTASTRRCQLVHAGGAVSPTALRRQQMDRGLAMIQLLPGGITRVIAGPFCAQSAALPTRSSTRTLSRVSFRSVSCGCCGSRPSARGVGWPWAGCCWACAGTARPAITTRASAARRPMTGNRDMCVLRSEGCRQGMSHRVGGHSGAGPTSAASLAKARVIPIRSRC